MQPSSRMTLACYNICADLCGQQPSTTKKHSPLQHRQATLSKGNCKGLGQTHELKRTVGHQCCHIGNAHVLQPTTHAHCGQERTVPSHPPRSTPHVSNVVGSLEPVHLDPVLLP